MEASISEWLNLVLRWTHVITGIAWIGSSFYFMWLDSHLEKPAKADENVAGRLWMVHSGGFYHVEKRYLAAGQVPDTLHWFKWEAAFTWLSGFFLLIVVYHWGGIAVDTGYSDLSPAAGAAIGLGLLAVSWLVYDGLWISPLGRHTRLASLISFALVVGVAYFLSKTLGGRSSYIHVGAMLGTLMVANVWVRILPAQREMIAATQAGKPRDLTLGERAKRRSIHNNYMTLPVVFIMISNHYPSTYGNQWNWLVLAALMLVGAGVRHHFNVRSRYSIWLFVVAGIVIGTLCYLTA